ncbi:MAG: CPBP family intramembrane metalloprotease [Sorangiineae bacterium]|nr:CPBP family intramembrane metalloprotease [Polyangiaceae bacterium]MEB2321626.1 CPBP family intramembrane metalloprotease [Sorangiineae bacterium]
MRYVFLVMATATAAIAFAMRPVHAGSGTMWLGLAVPYAALGAIAVRKLWQDGTLLERLTPKWGDLSVGAVSAMLLLLGSWLARGVLAPAGTAENAWLSHVYIQVGSAELLQRSALETSALLVIPIFEELAFRGLLQGELTERLGARRAAPLSALFYAAASLPTVFTLADPDAGPNPLLVIAALGCGLVWGYTTSMVKRLPPAMFSHMAFVYFSAVQFRWPGM